MVFTLMTEEKERRRLPRPIEIAAFVLAVFALGITFQLLYWSDDDVLREQTIYWFLIALVAAVLPWIRYFKWKDLEFSLEKINKEVEVIANTRYANLVYLIDVAGNLAVVSHSQYNDRWIPCGTRLDHHEMPDLAVHRAVSTELGLNATQYEFWPEYKRVTYGNAQILPRPYQVQWEKQDHRQGVPYHYDFVYVCKAKGECPVLNGVERAKWISYQEFRESSESNEKYTFPDVLPTLEKILREMGHL